MGLLYRPARLGIDSRAPEKEVYKFGLRSPPVLSCSLKFVGAPRNKFTVR
jgi:hypothetical protein